MVIPASKRLAPEKGIIMNTIDFAQSSNNKLTRLSLGNVIIWFSYSTPVAYSAPGTRGVITSDKGWTETTRRHIGTIVGRRSPVAHRIFTAGLENIMSHLSQAMQNVVIPTTLIDALDITADAMYDREATWRDFAGEFTVEELRQLATLCQITPDGGGRSYDDEVFDALANMEANGPQA